MLSHTSLIFYRALFFCVYSTIGVLFPFLVLYLRSGVGLNDREIAMISSLGGITITLFQQVWGYIADVLVPKKSLLLGTTLGSGVLFLLVGSLTHSWALALAIFAFNCLFTSINQLLHGFLFSHPGSEPYFGVLRAWGSLGFVVTNVCVGVYSDRIAGGNLGFIFPLFLGITVVAALLLLPIAEHRTLPPVRPHFWAVQKYFLRKKQVLVFLLLAFVYQSAHTPSYGMQSLLMADMGADRSTVAYSYSLAALLELPVFFAAGALIVRFGAPVLMLGCAVLQTARWALVWWCREPLEVIFVSLSHCITFGLFYAAAVTYMNNHAGLHLKASAQTLFALVFQGFAGVVGNIVGGQALSGGALSPVSRFLVTQVYGLPDRGDLPNLFIACSTVAGLSVLLAAALLFVDRRQATSTAS